MIRGTSELAVFFGAGANQMPRPKAVKKKSEGGGGRGGGDDDGIAWRADVL
jgi:hypothetical protein